MHVHVYGIIDSRAICGPVPAGHEADAATAVPFEDMAAIVSQADDAAIEPSLNHVWHHEKVLGALMERHAVLPMRFGTICPTEEVSALLRQRSDALRAGLRQVRGKVEMAVRITQSEPPPGEAGNRTSPNLAQASSAGKSYLLALAARHGHMLGDGVPALRALHEAREHLEQLSLKMVWQGPEADGKPFKVSCLVAREEIENFANKLRDIERPDLRLSCTGPWAPYSFVGEEAILGAGR